MRKIIFVCRFNFVTNGGYINEPRGKDFKPPTLGD